MYQPSRDITTQAAAARRVANVPTSAARSLLRVAKHASATALSQQVPTVPIDWVTCRCAHRVWQVVEVYWLPRSL